MAAGPHYIASARTAQKMSLPLLHVLSLGKELVDRAVPQQQLLDFRLFTQLLLGSGFTYHNIYHNFAVSGISVLKTAFFWDMTPCSLVDGS
jgi:hypothetical protein